MTSTDLYIELFKNLKRLGPGSDSQTAKALEITNLILTDNQKIADLGCGTGAQTLVLAKNSNAQIYAVDNEPEFIKTLKTNIDKHHLNNKITPIVGSIDDLPFHEDVFDLIWAEGAAYILGFEKGVQYWRKFLKKNGLIVVSEVSWLSEKQPIRLKKYWKKIYPEIDSIANKKKVLMRNGFFPMAQFVLPNSCWTLNYYTPLKKALFNFKEKYNNHPDVMEIATTINEEIQMFEKHNKHYGFVFYIAKKTSKFN